MMCGASKAQCKSPVYRFFPCQEILLSNFDNLVDLEGESLKTVIQMVPPWVEVTKADFRYNNLQKVDASVVSGQLSKVLGLC